VQPHRYTRVANLFEEFCTCFNDADAVIVAEIYPAGETPIAGVNRDALVAGVRAHGHRSVVPLAAPEDLAPLVAGLAKAGDFVVCLGAGFKGHPLVRELGIVGGQELLRSQFH